MPENEPLTVSMHRSVLVVEDDDPSRVARSLLLVSHGYVVWSAADALRGFKLLREHRPARLLLDLTLPGQPGEHLLHAARAVSADTRVAVLTGSTDEGRLSDLGVELVLQKPFDVRAVLDWLAGA